ncbi:MAG: NAD(P)/FAD-dependent oxidoreductase, partial [Hyphomonadaceae bacterium]|nr:NAD(P)/FAD-dependent oxidoreductase [Clostridia bacterium]
MHYVIIGNSAAAVAAIEAIRKIDLESQITVISDEPYHTYSRPMISHYLEGKTTKERMAFRAMDFYERYQVQAMLGVKAVVITRSTVIL